MTPLEGALKVVAFGAAGRTSARIVFSYFGDNAAKFAAVFGSVGKEVRGWD